MNAARLLEVLRDARDEGLWQEQAEVLRQLDIDCKHVRFVVRNRPLMPRMYSASDWEEADDYGDPEPAMSDDEITDRNRHLRIQKALEWRRADWTAWRRRVGAITSIADIYKRAYSDAHVSTLAGRASAVLEWAQAGIIDRDTAQQLLTTPEMPE